MENISMLIALASVIAMIGFLKKEFYPLFA